MTDDQVDEQVDELWERVNRKDSALMSDWTQCFSDNECEKNRRSRREIKMSLTQREWQTDPNKNFLWRLMSTDWGSHGYRNHIGQSKRRFDLAMLFLGVMTENSYWNDFIVATLGPRHSEIDLSDRHHIRSELKLTRKNECDETGTTPLHEAARFENIEKVRKLIRDEETEIWPINQHGYTPLHFAAMAINPKAEIAKLLVDSVNKNRRCLNKRTDYSWGGNTALHIAAANVSVTEEFIQQFKEADSRLYNSRGDTPFQVAAKSRNPYAIIYMLNTFSPTNNLWDVDNVDKYQNYKNTLINICARKGNAEAVALLIKHGADISQGVLHEIVIESVRNPEKINSLVHVYKSIVDNAVIWRYLEEDKPTNKQSKPTNRQLILMKVERSEKYSKLFRETMISLLTKPMENYYERDVLQCALAYGASEMFWQIINTKAVFRINDEETWKYVDQENEEDQKNDSDVDTGNSQESWIWTVFDVTNFTQETFLKSSDPASETDSSKRGNLQDPESQQALTGSTESNNGQNSTKRHPDMPYLTYLLTVFDQWKSSNILCTQPLKELTKPYATLIQRFYLILGLLQLLFVISFTVYFMPTPCSLAQMFNVSTTGCNISTYNNSYAMTPTTSQQRSWIAVLWLIWPIILITANELITVHYLVDAKLAYTYTHQSKKKVFISKDLHLSFINKLLRVLLRTVPLRTFCCMVFVWFYVYFRSESHELYVEVTAMVLLFGSITNLLFFGAMSQTFSISVLVLEEIIANDIPIFLLFFGFTVVGFSFAMHTIRMSACMHNKIIYLHETFFAVLSSAFGIGDFFESTITDPTCAGGNTEFLFEIVYFGYVCATMIILLNILIAMLNYRYEKAKLRAENIWRFRILSAVKAFERYTSLVEVMKNCRILDLFRPADNFMESFGCFVGCCYRDKNSGSVILKSNLKPNRYYLKMLLPVDEQFKSRSGRDLPFL